MTTRYIPHIVYTIALTSISTHLLWHRKEYEEQRRHHETHISLLENTIARLKSGERASEKEFERIIKFGKGPELDTVEEVKEIIGWRAVLLGRKDDEGQKGDLGSRTIGEDGHSDWERKDLEKLKQEIRNTAS